MSNKALHRIATMTARGLLFASLIVACGFACAVDRITLDQFFLDCAYTHERDDYQSFNSFRVSRAFSAEHCLRLNDREFLIVGYNRISYLDTTVGRLEDATPGWVDEPEASAQIPGAEGKAVRNF